jgi:tetratricopeptide (TPR) repeat protein
VRTTARFRVRLMLLAVWLVVAIIFPTLCGVSAVPKQKSKVVPESSVSVKLELARKFQSQGWMGEAQVTLEEILAAHPDNSDARALLEQVRAAQKQRADLAAELQLAEAAKSAGLLDDAKGKLEEILKTDPEYPEANTLLAEVLAAKGRLIRQREQMQLDAAEWQLKSGDAEKAIELSQKVLDSANDPEIARRARKIHDEAKPSWLSRLRIMLTLDWLGILVAAIVVILAFWCFLWGARKLISSLYLCYHNRRDRSPVWQVRSINDSTQLGAEALVMSALSKLRDTQDAPASAGLLRLESLILPNPHLLLPADTRPSVDVPAAVEKLQLKIGGIDVGTVIRFLQQMEQWFKCKLPPEPSISGAAFLCGASPSEVTVRLTQYGPDGRIATVSAAVAEAAGVDAAQSAAERAAEKMYYLLAESRGAATGTNVSTADAVVEGLNFLRKYANGEKDDLLEKGLERFQALRAARPELLEACLYEGIMLDLLERHDEALVRFKYVREKTAETDPLHDKAVYNQAVALMRKYRPDDLREAGEIFQRAAGASPDILRQPVKVLAQAARANVIAHYPIFWQRLLYQGKAKDDAECLDWKRTEWRSDGGPGVFAWLLDVKQIAEELKTTLGRIREAAPPEWDAPAMRQLEWAISNAVGNAHLNVATGFLEPPRPPEFDDMGKKQEELLSGALREFHRCEMLLAPGVETLTNLATAYLFLNRFDDARVYAQRAIELNRNYEYAYFRLAHSWDRENRGDKAKEVLAGYKNPVRIPEFKALFGKYHVPLPD